MIPYVHIILVNFQQKKMLRNGTFEQKLHVKALAVLFVVAQNSHSGKPVCRLDDHPNS